MKIDHEFTVSVPIDRAWAVLTDLEGIAPCMPGAQLTGVDGDVYSGKVKIKVGPVVSQYAGTVRFLEKDDANHRAVIDAKGRDSRGAGNASAAITALLRADGDRTHVSVDTDLKISGRIAQFGNGMIKEVSTKLLGQFVTSLEEKLRADGAPAGTPAAASPPAPEATPAEPAAAETGPAEAASAETASAGTPAAATATPSATEVPSAEAASAETLPAEAAPAASPDAGSVAAESPGTPPEAPPAAGAAAATAVTGTATTPSAATTSASSPSPSTASATADGPATEPAATKPEQATATGARVITPAAEAEPLDVLSLAGGSIYKRLIPVVIAAVVVIAVIVYLVAF